MRIAPSTRRTLAIVLVGYSALLALALLAPTSDTQSSMASWVRDLGSTVGFSTATATQPRAEFLGNVAIMAPVAALGSLLWERTTWRAWTAFGFLVAGAVELAQGVFLPDRTASFADVVANTLGCLLGAVSVAVVRRGGGLDRLDRRRGQPPANGGRNSTVDPGGTRTAPGSSVLTGRSPTRVEQIFSTSGSRVPG